DPVAMRVGWADAVGIPVTGEHDRLVRPPRAGQAGDDVATLDMLDPSGQSRAEGRAEVDRAEAGDPRLPFHRLEIEPRAAEQIDRDGALDPALQQYGLARPGREADRIIFACRRLHGVPAIASALGLVEDRKSVV